MQTTLLGLALAIIVALVAALVAPYVVDWNRYRSDFEAEASRLTGMTVRVNGPIEARILPSSVVILHDVAIGAPGRPPALRAASLELEVGLAPLLRGRLQASTMHLRAPQISLGLDRSGAIDWPAPPASFHPQSLSVSRLDIEDGTVVLNAAASGARVVLRKLSFDGDIRSLLGPFGGAGGFAVDNEHYDYRISGSQSDGGGFKVRLGVDPSNHPLTTEIDGTVTVDRGVPQFDGTLALARPVGATLANGERVMNDPWQAAAEVHATPAAAELKNVVIAYGPEERAVNLTGSAKLTFGSRPHLQGTISAMQVDLDRALATPDLTDQPPLLVVRRLFAGGAAAIKPPIPAEIKFGIDALTVGGTALQSFRGGVSFDNGGWSLDSLEFQAPGFTDVKLSGRLALPAGGFTFAGPGTLQSADAATLLAWLDGRHDLTSDQTRTMTARGDITIASDRIAVDKLAATFGEENVAGRLAYSWPAEHRAAKLDADLNAASLDLDAVTTFAKGALADGKFAWPREGSLALDLGRATFAGVAAQTVKARVEFDAGTLQVEQFSVGDLGGAKLAISGRIGELSTQPHGQLTLDLDAASLAGLNQVFDKLAPRAATTLGRLGDRLAPAKVSGLLSIAPSAKTSVAKLDLNGQLGLMRIAVSGQATGAPSHLAAARLQIDSRLDADDGTTLMALLGLDRVIAVDQFPGSLTLSAAGPLNGDIKVDGKVAASGIDAALHGALRLEGQQAPSGTFQMQASVADLRPLHQAMTGQPGIAVPASARAALAVAGSRLSLTDIAATIGKGTARGRLAVTVADPIGIDGDIAADNVDAAAVVAMLLGMPSKPADAAGVWSNAPIGAGAFSAVNGAVAFKLDHATLTPALVATTLSGVARFRPSEIAVDDLEGSLAGGRVAGAMTFRRDEDGIAAHARLALSGADAAPIIASSGNPIAGNLSLELQGDSIAPNPAALVAALHGSGTLTLTDAHFAGIDTKAFDSAIEATDQSGAITMPSLQSVVANAMANGALAVPYGNAALTITSGQINLANVTLPAQHQAELTFNGVVDLNTAAIEARMTLSEPAPANGLIRTRPELLVSLHGPFAAPVRKVDVSTLATWLTLRAAELQTRRIEALEASQRDTVLPPVSRPPLATVRVVRRGDVFEFTKPMNAANAANPARGLDRLQPQPPPPAGSTGTANTNLQDTAARRPAPRPLGPASSAAPPSPRKTTPSIGAVLNFLFRPQN